MLLGDDRRIRIEPRTEKIIGIPEIDLGRSVLVAASNAQAVRPHLSLEGPSSVGLQPNEPNRRG